MAITYPLDFLDTWPGYVASFDLHRRMEESRTGAGRTIPKDIGDPLWKMRCEAFNLPVASYEYWKARLELLEEGLQQFIAYNLTKRFPITYPSASWPTGVAFSGDTAAVHTVDGNNKALRVKSLPAGFQLKIGDMIRVSTANLYKVQEDATADGAGVTPLFEVRPHFWPGIAADQAVSVKRPYCLMALVRGTLKANLSPEGMGTISFDAMEAR